MAKSAKASSNGKAAHWVGKKLKRKEDPRLIQGISHYTDDLKLAGMLHCVLVRSPHAHAEIKAIRTDAARALPGVVAVFTGEDTSGVGPVPCAMQMPDLKIPRHPVLAMGRVRYLGEPVAAIVAEDIYTASDAAELVEVDYEPLPVVTDLEKALGSDSACIHEQFKSNQAFTHTLKGGDIEAAFKKADHVVSQRMINQRLAPIAMEPRAVLAEYLPGENRMTIWSSTQIPHLLRTQVSVMLGLPETAVRVITPEVGGGFGSKLNVYGEEGIVPWLAMKVGRPVKWNETRRENFLATIHGRDTINDVELALKKDGRILGLRCRILADMGAYHQLLTPLIPQLTALMHAGCYKIPAIQIDIVGVFTNKMSTDAYRGAGRPEATYNVERIMDIGARELGMDPVEFRLKNLPQPKEFPFTTITGLTYDSAKYQDTLKKALKLAGYDALRRRQKAGAKSGKYYGIGVSTYVEICAIGPSAATPAGGWESGTIRIEPTGKVTLLTGASPHGQGEETTFAQLIADELGIDPNDVNVIHGDTLAVPYGIGTFGSRGTAVGGTAAFMATQKLKAKMSTLAAHLLGCKAADVTFGRGRLSAKGGKKSISFGELVMAAYTAHSIPAGFEPGLEATHFFEPPNFTFPFGTHIASVEVDAETGEVKIEKYVGVDDCGNVINPLIVDGQIHGGIAQGMGQAMWEELIYNEDGQLVTGSFMDYVIPKAHFFPEFTLDRTVTPSPVNPMGVKGVGEAGTIASTPCMVNAVCDALSSIGVRHIDMPLKPERVWKAISNAQGGAHNGQEPQFPPELSRAKRGSSTKTSKSSSRRRP
ncbi:MAG TPA: xanthine dehydrogenase family protein molybdopterin-binding subunit [Terriglobales bacterium]|jgi:carbon-monoxide dehydrogenase large subunit|nr:xanthine dehydrogenase family protein molybdopterin-binding subunit [Terriglobales bacterium]